MQSLLFILMTLQARTHYLNFKASRLRLWACGISLKITELSVWGALSEFSTWKPFYLPGTNSRAKPEQIGVGEGSRTGVSTFHVGLNQFPSHSSPAPPPRPRPPSPHHLQLNTLLRLAHGSLQGPQQLL